MNVNVIVSMGKEIPIKIDFSAIRLVKLNVCECCVWLRRQRIYLLYIYYLYIPKTFRIYIVSYFLKFQLIYYHYLLRGQLLIILVKKIN